MSEPILRQMKLTNGDEIICEVIDWESEEGPAIVVRNAFRIITVDRQNGLRYHIFRPLMVMQIEDEFFQTLNTDHIIVEATPSKEVVKEYYNALKIETDEETNVDEKMEEYMKKITDMLDAKELEPDSDAGDKVIRFPGRNKLH